MNLKSAGLLLAALSTGGLMSTDASAWGDEGHKVVALIADHYLDDSVRLKVGQLLAGDTSKLVPNTDIADEATWADKYRDFMRTGSAGPHYLATRDWHFVDIEIDGSNTFDKACFDHPALPAGTPASAGPKDNCVVDKVTQFSSELANSDTSEDERRMALQFLLHFLGDMHQPLHASDDHDSGGNAKMVKADKISLGKLHGYWDTQFVERLGTKPDDVALALISTITPAQIASWKRGTPVDWAGESSSLAKSEVYAKLPAPTPPPAGAAPGPDGKPAEPVYMLDQTYVDNGVKVVSSQLQKAGIRLASILNTALADTAPSPTTPGTPTIPTTPVSTLPSAADLLARGKALPGKYIGAKSIAKLPSGAVIFQSVLQLDADGSVYCKQDASGLRETSLQVARSQSLDANAVPYFVIPLKAAATFPGVAAGDVGVIWYHDHRVYAVVGDRGPTTKLGEASIAAFRALGEERVDKTRPARKTASASCKSIPSDGSEGYLINRGMATLANPATTIVFPGSRKDIDRSSVNALITSVNKAAEVHLAAENVATAP